MQMQRFHKDVYMPKVDFEHFWASIKSLKFTKHFKTRYLERSMYSRHFLIPTISQLKCGEVFEMVLIGERIQKLCIRISGEYCTDYCYVVDHCGNIVTTWATGKYNQYDKLDRSLYSTKLGGNYTDLRDVRTSPKRNKHRN